MMCCMYFCRITRYDVGMNGKVIYSGTELHCTARHLTPNTEYTFIVSGFTPTSNTYMKSREVSLPAVVVVAALLLVLPSQREDRY